MQAGFLAVGLYGLPYHTITNSEGKSKRLLYKTRYGQLWACADFPDFTNINLN